MKICKSICFYLISPIVLFWGCNNTVHQNLTHDEYVLHGYLESLGLSVPLDSHTFILIPNASCPGCKKLALQYAEDYSNDTLTCIVAMESFPIDNLDLRDYLIIDSCGLLDNLNWDYYGIIEIKTDNGKIKMIETYDASNSIERFIGKTVQSSCMADCEDCKQQSKLY